VAPCSLVEINLHDEVTSVALPSSVEHMLSYTVNMGEIVLLKVYKSVPNHTTSHRRLRLSLQSMYIFTYK